MRLQVSVVTRDEVGAYKPYLWEQSSFCNGVLFREWILTKIVNGERASYSAPKFARMQERTRSQMLEDIVANLQNHAETGQIPKPYRYGIIFLFEIASQSFPRFYWNLTGTHVNEVVLLEEIIIICINLFLERFASYIFETVKS